MKIFEIFEDQQKYYIVIELMNGKSLLEYISSVSRKELTEGRLAELMIQVLSGLNCCHIQGIAHRDIKLENLMFSDEECTVLKIIDFGFAKFSKEGHPRFNEFLGSPMYMAPEILTQIKYNEKCDIWSCGILCYIILSGNTPYKMYDDDTIQTLFQLIKKAEFTKDSFRSADWKYASEDAKDFTLALLQKDPSARPSAKEMLGHPWLKLITKVYIDNIEAKETMKRLLRINVNI